MARSRTLTNLISDVRSRVNQENSTFVTDAELTEYLNQEIARLHTHLVQGSGHPHFRNSTTFAVTSTTNLQALPADFYQVQEITATIGGTTGSITPFMASERGFLKNASVWSPLSGVQYRIQANNIEFLPASQSFTATMYYVPCATRLVNGSDVWDGFCGYETVPIYGACAIVLAKEESDPSFYKGLQAEAYADIDMLIAQRDASNPERVHETIGSDPYGWFGR